MGTPGSGQLWKKLSVVVLTIYVRFEVVRRFQVITTGTYPNSRRRCG